MPTGDAGGGCVLSVQELDELSGLRARGCTHVQHLQENCNEPTNYRTRCAAFQTSHRKFCTTEQTIASFQFHQIVVATHFNRHGFHVTLT